MDLDGTANPADQHDADNLYQEDLVAGTAFTAMGTTRH